MQITSLTPSSIFGYTSELLRDLKNSEHLRYLKMFATDPSIEQDRRVSAASVCHAVLQQTADKEI